MNLLLTQAIPVMAGTLGIAFLYQLYREGRVAITKRRRTDEEYWAELGEFEDTVSSPVFERDGFDTLESALTLSFTVVCLELLCYLVYLSVTKAPETDMTMLQALRGNAISYAGLTVVVVAGVARVKNLLR